MLEPGRAFVAGTSYRYGFNGQEISTEISSSGNLYSAEFWEYDSRSVRRWNLDPKPTMGISPYSAFNNSPILLSDVLGDSIPKDNNNYLLPYNPVFNAPNFSTGLSNAITNAGNFLSNVSVGMLSEGAKGVQNYFAGGYKEPATADPIQGVLDFTHSQGEYLFHTPINQQLTDLGHAATDLHNYELPAQLAIGGFASFSKISVAGNFSLKSGAALADGSYYSVAFETKLSSDQYPGVYRGAHFKAANESLNAAMQSDATFASSMQQLGVSIPTSPAGSIFGKSPANWVWHHDINAGVMQLVPKAQHTPGSTFWNTLHPGGVGGFSIWGR